MRKKITPNQSRMEPEFECTEAVVKIASRCNINCTYCYMYNKGDNSYLKQPKFMSKEVYKAMFERFKAHCDENGLKHFAFSLHGGEPLLAGKEYLTEFINTANSIMKDVQLIFSIQTNGILLDQEWCKLFDSFKIDVGISIDVSKEAHNKYRIDHKGNGTYHETLIGLSAAKTHMHGRAPGILSVVDVMSDPAEVYDHFKSLGISSLDLLLPDNNYNDLPEGLNKNFEQQRKQTPYGNWLIEIFDRWLEDEHRMNIRMFSLIVRLILGKQTGNDQMGSLTSALLVIETDGGIEPADHMKICGPEFTKLGLNVQRHELKEIGATTLYQKFFHAKTQLPEVCQKCASQMCAEAGFFQRGTATSDNSTIHLFTAWICSSSLLTCKTKF